jgi:hypothetical protein
VALLPCASCVVGGNGSLCVLDPAHAQRSLPSVGRSLVTLLS